MSHRIRFEGDVQMKWTDDGGDITYKEGQPIMDGGLTTSVIISLFTLPGWWGNEIGDDDEKIGSKLLEALDKTLTIAVMQDAQEHARLALAWMVEQGVAKSVEVEASIPRADFLALKITIEEPNGENPLSQRFMISWENQSASLEGRE